MPVFTEQRLSNFSASRAYNAAMFFSQQALQLATNSDVLVGRADNGGLPSLRCSWVVVDADVYPKGHAR